jgi:hypothetical protein
VIATATMVASTSIEYGCVARVIQSPFKNRGCFWDAPSFRHWLSELGDTLRLSNEAEVNII